MPRGISRFRAPELQTQLILNTRTLAALTGSVNDYDLSGAGALFNIGGTGQFTITGIAGGIDGRVIELVNYLTFNLFLSNEDSGSMAQNRILTALPGGAAFQLSPDQSVMLTYDATVNRWLIANAVNSFDPNTDPYLSTLYRARMDIKRSGGMLTKSNFVNLLGTAQGFMKGVMTALTSGNVAAQAFGVVAGAQVSFTMPAAGLAIAMVSGTAFKGITVTPTAEIGVRFDSDTPLKLNDMDGWNNGSGSDTPGDIQLFGLWGKSLAKGSHTADLCFGGVNYGLLANAAQPAVISVLYPG